MVSDDYTHKEGYEVDSNGRGYDPDAGSTEPIDCRCNALLTNWEERYGEKRYCSQIVPTRYDEDFGQFCSNHRGREELYMHAKESLKHGLFCKTVHHFYDKVDPHEKVFIYGLYDQLLSDSEYDYDVEYREEHFDFGEGNFSEGVDSEQIRALFSEHLTDDDLFPIEVPNPTKLHDHSLALWNAAVFTVNMTRVNAILTQNDMQSKTVSHANLTAPSETGQEYRTIEEWTEHHLNLPLSRLVRDRKELLEYGGVGIDTEDGGEPNVTVEHYYDEPLSQDPVDPEALQSDEPSPLN